MALGFEYESMKFKQSATIGNFQDDTALGGRKVSKTQFAGRLLLWACNFRMTGYTEVTLLLDRLAG
jgi:hypothetical protein